MKQIRFAIFFCWLFGAATLASGQLALRLESDAREKLTGLPVPLRVVILNTGSTEARLPLLVYMNASRNDEERFVGSEIAPWRKTPVDDEGDRPDWDPRPVLAPGASLTAELPISPECDGPGSLTHSFLWPAGRYTIRALMSLHGEELGNAVEREATLEEVTATVPGLTISNPWTIDVREPEGVDAQAWDYVLQNTAGRGWRHVTAMTETALVRELRSRYPTSHYARCFGMAFLHAESFSTVEELAADLRAATPRPPMLDWLELTVAGQHKTRCEQLYVGANKDVEAAIRYCDTARVSYQRVIDTATSATVRARAAESIVQVKTAEEIQNLSLRFAALDAGTYQKVTPLLQCVKETGARLEARFSYNNPNSFIVYNPAGQGNLFTPEPQDRGQPTAFLPGLHEGVVTAEIAGKRDDPQRTIAWTVEGTTVSAPLETAPRCKGK